MVQREIMMTVGYGGIVTLTAQQVLLFIVWVQLAIK